MTDAGTLAGQHPIAVLPPVDEVVRLLNDAARGWHYVAADLTAKGSRDERNALAHAAALRALAVAYPALVRDRDRMDWLERKTPVDRYAGLLIAITDGEWQVGITPDGGFSGWHDGGGKSLREAIDSVRVTPEREAERPEGHAHE